MSQSFSKDYIHPEFKAKLDKEKERFNLLKNNLGNIDLNNIPPEYLDQLRALLIEENLKEARENLYAFVKLVAHTLIPDGFKDGKHIELMCQDLTELEQSIVLSSETGGVVQPFRDMYFLPPGGMKSMLISRFFPAWCFGKHPTWNILQLGHNTDFAVDNFGRKLRDLMMSPEYQLIFPDTKIKSNTRAAQRFETTVGGVYYCTGAGSSIAGRRAHVLISDDVISEQNAYSEKERNTINNWYVPGARSRLRPDGTEIVVNTRWHLEDLSGYLMKVDEKSKRPWRIRKLPAILDAESAKTLGLPEGGSFWPQFWPMESLLDKKHSLLPSKWSALYQQNPIPEEGSWIKQEWIKWWDTEKMGEPEVDYVLCSIDSAFGGTSKQADYTAITLWGVFSKREEGYGGNPYQKNQMVLLGAKRGKQDMDFPTLLNILKDIEENWHPDLYIIEKKGSGISLVQELKLKGYPIYEYQPDRDKKARVFSVTDIFHRGSIWLPANKSYAQDVMQELISFPYAPHDDYVDSTTQAILWMRKNYMLAQPEEYGYQDEEDDDLYNANRFTRTGYWNTR